MTLNVLALPPELESVFWVWCALLGLAVGSFLNVLCLRLPKMMERSWRRDCCELLGTDLPDTDGEAFNLAFPPSHCPKCNHAIRAWENIPVISYLLLAGKCSGCATPISFRYPLVESIAGIFSAVVALHFGFSYACAAALLLSWALIALSVIDFDTQLLPDDITQPLLWAGLLLSMNNIFCSLPDALLGAASGYLSLWVVSQAYKLATGREQGMGQGDFKLLAALGAWLGWQALPLIILLSSMAGSIIGLSMIALRGYNKQTPIPFGPYLAIAGWITLLWRDPIISWYTGLI